MRQRRRVLRGLLAAGSALICIGAISACSSTPTGSSAKSASIVVGAAQGIPQLNPAIRTFGYEETLFPLLWSALTKTSQDGTIGPDLAASWTNNADATEWTFKLVSGAKFSDGSPITAATVKSSFDYYLDPKTVTQERNKIDAISSVTAPDDTTVVIKLSRPNGILPESIVWVKILKVDALSTINTAPVTSGPFMVKSFSPNDTLVMGRNEHYSGPKPKLDEIKVVKAADSTAAVTSLRTGDLNVLWATPFADVKSLETDPNLQIVRPAVLSDAVDWEVDMTSPPFNNLAARQALAYATNRAAILETAYYGQGVVSSTNSILADGNPAKAKGLQEYPYDLEKAKNLFAQAGVTSGTKLTWWAVAGQYPEWQASGQILQASLREIGIELEIKNSEIAAWADKFYPAGKKFPGLIVPNGLNAPAQPAFSLNFLLSGRCECNLNNTQYDAAFANAVGTVDAEQRNQAWAEPQKMENELVPLIIPIIKSPAAGVSRTVEGVWLEGGGQLHLEDASVSS
jgi:peptide/nickel transport system substrate-binding protein